MYENSDASASTDGELALEGRRDGKACKASSSQSPSSQLTYLHEPQSVTVGHRVVFKVFMVCDLVFVVCCKYFRDSGCEVLDESVVQC